MIENISPAERLPTFDQVSGLISYSPETGELKWKAHPSRPNLVGAVVGSVNRKGYRQVCFLGFYLKAHRIAWLLAHGSWPEAFIDHVNGDRLDNRLCNLRVASKTENNRNKAGWGRLSKGVYLEPSGRFRATIRILGRSTHLGTFDTEEEAHAAYCLAAEAAFGKFARAA